MTETNPPNSPSPKRVLVVDDVAPVVNTIKAMLAQFGHEVDFAPNGREALAMYQPCKYDLVITDYSMPTLDGLELAKAIKKQAPEQLILLISAYTFRIAANEGKYLPVDLVLRKPFSIREFQAALAELFGAGQTA